MQVATRGAPGGPPGGPSGLLAPGPVLAAAALATACAIFISRPLLRRQLRVFTMAACVVLDYKVQALTPVSRPCCPVSCISPLLPCFLYAWPVALPVVR